MFATLRSWAREQPREPNLALTVDAHAQLAGVEANASLRDGIELAYQMICHRQVFIHGLLGVGTVPFVANRRGDFAIRFAATLRGFARERIPGGRFLLVQHLVQTGYLTMREWFHSHLRAPVKTGKVL